MKTTSEKLKLITEFSNDEFQATYMFIGEKRLKEAFKENYKKIPNKAVLGFKSKIKDSQLISPVLIAYYIDQIYYGHANYNVDFFIDVLDETINNFSTGMLKVEFANNPLLYHALNRLYEFNFDESFLEEFKSISDEFYRLRVALYGDIQGDSEKSLESANIDKLNQTIKEKDKMIKNLNKKLESEIKSVKSFKIDLLTSVVHTSRYTNIFSKLKQKDFTNYQSMKQYLIDSISNNINLINNNKLDILKEELTIQYIVTNLIEVNNE